MENLTPEYIQQILTMQSKAISTLVTRLARIEKKFPDDNEDENKKVEQASAEEIEALMKQFGI